MTGRFEEIAEDGVFLDVRAEVSRRNRPTERLAHHVGRVLSSTWVLALLTTFGLLWILANSGSFPWKPWDSFPFPMLGTIYSIVSPLLAILILMRQYEDQRISELTSEVELQVMLHTERKITAALRLLEAIRRETDPELDQQDIDALLDEIEHDKLVEAMQRRLDQDERSD